MTLDLVSLALIILKPSPAFAARPGFLFSIVSSFWTLDRYLLYKALIFSHKPCGFIILKELQA